MIFKTIVGDNREHLTGAASLALSRAEIVIFMGGLGPTEDDLTREAVADALGLELRRDLKLSPAWNAALRRAAGKTCRLTISSRRT